MRQHFRLSSFVLAALIVRNNRVVAQSNGNTAADTPTLVRSQPAPDSIITKRAFFNFNAGLAIQIEQLRQIAPKEAETVRSKFSSLFGITVAEFDDLAATSARVITELAGVRASAQSYAKLRTEASKQPERNVLEHFASQENSKADKSWDEFQYRLAENSRQNLARYISEIYVKGITVWQTSTK